MASVLRVLGEADGALTAIEVKKALQAGGVKKAAADEAWPAVQKRLKVHDDVLVEGNRYRRKTPPAPPSALEALDLLLQGDVADARKGALVEAVRAALAASQPEPGPAAEPAPKPGPAPESAAAAAQPDPEPDLEEAARQRQAAIDAVKLLADLASEVEELIANETEPEVMIRQIRAWVKRSGLDPVGRAGEETKFDRKTHRPIGGQIRDGATVIVVRPGYIYKAPEKDLLIGKAVVEE